VQGRVAWGSFSVATPEHVCRVWCPCLFFSVVARYVGVWVVSGFMQVGGEIEVESGKKRFKLFFFPASMRARE